RRRPDPRNPPRPRTRPLRRLSIAQLPPIPRHPRPLPRGCRGAREGDLIRRAAARLWSKIIALPRLLTTPLRQQQLQLPLLGLRQPGEQAFAAVVETDFAGAAGGGEGDVAEGGAN